MASTAQSHYAERQINGVYDSLRDLIKSSGTGFLSNCEFNKHFSRMTMQSKHFRYQSQDASEFKVNIFGEIQPESLGTRHSALGDFYIGTNSKVRL